MLEIKDKELHRIAVTAIIYKPEFVYLITKRAPHKKFMPNKWTAPGGGANIDDYINRPKTTSDAWYGALEYAVRREVREEVGLEIGKPEFLIDYTLIRPDGIPVLGLSYFAPYISGEVKLDEDATEFSWISLEEAGKYDLIEGILEEIKQVDEILRRRGGFAPRRGPLWGSGLVRY